MGDTLKSQPVFTRLQRIAEMAASDPKKVFISLAHLIDVDFLREAHHLTRKDSAPGYDKVTADEYAVGLEANLENLYQRIKTGTYRAPPVERTWIQKEDGKQRPIGKPTFEDKILQRAVVMLMNSIYEQDFFSFSHGFRPGHSQHMALHELREQCHNLKITWVIDADVSGCFDNISHGKLQEIIRQRVNDGGLLRLIGKWLHAGVLEKGIISYPDKGTQQGGVASPLLANIFLHHILDEWFVRDVKPRMTGRCFLIRWADDFVIGFENESDARRVMEVLPKRFGKFELTIHPVKTRLISFRPPTQRTGKGKGENTFDFLGFTHYWGKSLKGNWAIMRKTAQKRMRRAKKAIWTWCRDNRHEPLARQHETLVSKLRGHFQYYAVRKNSRCLHDMREFIRHAWKYWLSRRSGRSWIPWENYEKILKEFPFPQPRIIHYI